MPAYTSLRLVRTVLLEGRLWASALEMVPIPGKRAVDSGRRSAEAVLKVRAAVAFSGVIVDARRQGVQISATANM
jgi:hypothetical protein